MAKFTVTPSVKDVQELQVWIKKFRETIDEFEKLILNIPTIEFVME